MKAMTAVEVLDALGCGEDPVTFKHQETTVDGLEHALNVETNGKEFDVLAGRVHLRFYSGHGYRHATLLGMLKARFAEAVAGKHD